MKQFFILSLLVLGFTKTSLAQKELDPPYLRFPTVPPLNLIMPDGSNFTNENLKKNQPTLIMFFSPDCDHCKHETEEIIKNISSFQKIQIVMATFESLEKMNAFYSNYKLADYPNIHVGRDQFFTLPPFFKIKNFPFLATYDKKGNLLKTFEGSVKMENIIKSFKK